MVKKSRGKQRGILQFSVRKHQVRTHFDGHDVHQGKTDYEETVSQLAQITLSYLTFVCSKFNLLPFEPNADGTLVPLSVMRGVIQHGIVTLFLSMMIRHLFLFIWCMAADGVDLNSIMCLTYFIYNFSTTSVAIVSTFNARGTMDMINSWQPQIDWIAEETGSNVSIYGRTMDNIKVTVTAVTFHLVALEFAVIGLTLETVPSTCYGLLRSLGFDPASIGLAWLSRILLAPAELAVALATGWAAAYNIVGGILSLGLIRIYFSEMR